MKAKTKVIVKPILNNDMKENLKNKFKAITSSHSLFCSFIGGILFATPFIQEWLFTFTFLGLILFFSVLEFPKDKRDKSMFKCFFAFLFGCFLLVYTLFFNLYPFEGFDFTKAQGATIVIFAWLGASLIHSLIGSFILNISRQFSYSPIIFSLSIGSLWVIFEWSMSIGFLAFPWVNISVALVKLLPFLQTASIFGNGIITFITVFSSALLGIYFNSKINVSESNSIKIKKRFSLFKISCLVLSINFIVGTFLYIIPENKEKEVNVCIVQGNVTMGEKWDAEKFYSILSNHDKLIRNSLNNSKEQKVDIVLMAETVFPAICTENGLIYQTISKITKEYDVTVIFGVMLKKEDDILNAIMAIYPDGKVSDYYTKQKLVPFGEKMPELGIIGELIPQLKELNDSASYVEGTTSNNIKSFDGTSYGALICYDSVFSELSRQSVRNGAEIIAVSTNDAWYKDGAAVKNHKSQSIIRAIETGRYIFRSANTGISCVIDTKGNVLCATEILEKTAIFGKGYTTHKNTAFVLLGNTSLFFSFILIAYLFILKLYKKTKNYSTNINL